MTTYNAGIRIVDGPTPFDHAPIESFDVDTVDADQVLFCWLDNQPQEDTEGRTYVCEITDDAIGSATSAPAQA